MDGQLIGEQDYDPSQDDGNEVDLAGFSRASAIPLTEDEIRAATAILDESGICVATVQRKLRIGWSRAADLVWRIKGWQALPEVAQKRLIEDRAADMHYASQFGQDYVRLGESMHDNINALFKLKFRDDAEAKAKFDKGVAYELARSSGA